MTLVPLTTLVSVHVCVYLHTQSVSPGSGLFSSLQTEDPMAQASADGRVFLLTKQTDQE